MIFCFPLFFFFWNNVYLLISKALNPFRLEEMKAVFHLIPLSDAPNCHGISYIPSEAVECSMAAMSILQAIYAVTEDRIRRGKLYFSLKFVF